MSHRVRVRFRSLLFLASTGCSAVLGFADGTLATGQVGSPCTTGAADDPCVVHGNRCVEGTCESADGGASEPPSADAGPDHRPAPDGPGPIDSGAESSSDGASGDSGPGDGGPFDSGPFDSGPFDSGPFDAGTGGPVRLGQGFTNAHDLAILGDSVYVTANGTVYRCLKTGCSSPSPIVTATSPPTRGIAARTSGFPSIFFTRAPSTNGSVWICAPGSPNCQGSLELLQEPSNPIAVSAAGPTEIYWVNARPNGNQLWAGDGTPGNGSISATAPGPPSPGPQSDARGAVIASQTNVYWTSLANVFAVPRPPATGPVRQVSVSGAGGPRSASTLALSAPDGILYWNTADAKVHGCADSECGKDPASTPPITRVDPDTNITTAVSALAALGNRLVWAEQTVPIAGGTWRIRRCRVEGTFSCGKAGTGPLDRDIAVAAGTGGAVIAMVLDGDTLYFLHDNELWSIVLPP